MICKGVILSQKILHEQDKFIDILTEDGVIEILVKGAAKLSGKTGSATQLFAYTEFDISDRKNRNDFYFLRSALPVRIFYGLRERVSAVALASYFAQVILYTALPKSSTPETLRLFLNCLHYLSEPAQENQPDEAQLKAIFELRVAYLAGFMPDVLMCRKCGCYLPESLYFSVEQGCFYCASCRKEGIFMPVGALQAVRHIVLRDLENIFHFRLTERCRKPLYDFAEQFLRYHTDREFPALAYYQKITQE